jgi:hypothetical protein
MLSINTKNLALEQKNGLKKWIDDGVITADLVNWYLQDSKSRHWLEQYCNRLTNEYQKTLNGDVRIRLNHLSALLNNASMADSIKENFFNSFLYGTGNNKRSIKKINFRLEGNNMIPESL